MRRHLVLLITVASIGLLIPVEAAALVQCAKVRRSTGEIRDGTPIRLRAECKLSEVELDPAALGLQGPPGTDGVDGQPGSQGNPGPQGEPGNWVVIDATGVLVGKVLSVPEPAPDGMSGSTSAFGAWIVRTLGGSPPLMMFVDRDGFPNNVPEVNGSGCFFFSGLNCTGQGTYGSGGCVHVPGLINVATVFFDRAFYPDENGTPVGIGSRASNSGCLSGSGVGTIPAIEFDLTQLALQPPFRLEAVE